MLGGVATLGSIALHFPEAADILLRIKKNPQIVEGTELQEREGVQTLKKNEGLRYDGLLLREATRGMIVVWLVDRVVRGQRKSVLDLPVEVVGTDI